MSEWWIMRIGWPAAWLLAIPAAALLWRLARGWGRATATLRVAAVVLLIAAVSGVQFRLGGQGVDVVVLLDRSLSMREPDRRECDELLQTILKQRGRGDRVAVVTFAQSARLQQPLQAMGDYAGETNPVSRDGTDLAAGLETALALLDRDRPGRVLVLSDGESTGADPMPAARRAAAAEAPIDYRLFERATSGDVAVTGMQLPEQIDQNEPFQFSAVVQSDHAGEVRYTLTRPGSEPIRGVRQVRPGANRMLFRDVINGRGVYDYQLAIEAGPGDAPENNTARGVVNVKAPPALLLVNHTGRPDNVCRALVAGKLTVDVVSAASADLRLERLAGYRGVILENASASDLGRGALRALRTFVTDMGGGLMMTGGRRSFGVGGYYQSELDDPRDPVLPVSMELRKEHRKLSSAMAIVMDRSGSMAAPAAGGRTKMDLANLGASDAVSLLSDMDSVAVVAVDSAAHLIVPLTSAGDRASIVSRIREVRSMGGGIFVYTGLVAGGKQVEKASQTNRHVILFADAGDSEEPGDYKALLEKFGRMGITVSVIGLGTDKDCDAELLKDIAKRGKGMVFFTQDPEELPRLFKQDTVSFAPDTFIRDPAGVAPLLDLRLLGEFRNASLPTLKGYNLTYLRPGAMLGYVTTDAFKAPVVAFWQKGLGRVSACTFEADGETTGAVAGWPEYSHFFVTSGRWLLGQGEPDGVRVVMDRRGSRGVVRLELDPERVEQATIVPTANLSLSREGEQTTRRLPLRWISDGVAEAEFDLDQTGTYQAAVAASGSRVVRSGAMCLPYSPEFAPRTDMPSGREVFSSIAAITGGQSRLGMHDVFQTTGRHRQWVDVRPLLLWLALIVVGLEIAGRRLGLWNAAGLGWLTRSLARVAATIPGRNLARQLWQRLGARRRPEATPVPIAAGTTMDPAPTAQANPLPAPPPVPKGSALERAKKRARQDFRRD